MPEFYTLEQAARVLGLSAEELRSKAQQREVHGFLDSGSWQFRKTDVEELARRRGMGSDPDLTLTDSETGAASDDNFDLSEFELSGSRPPSASTPPELTSITDPEDDILLDDINLPPNPMTSSSSTIIGMEPPGKRPSDSDVRLVPEQGKGASDSDVRLGMGSPQQTPSDSDVTLVSETYSGPGSSDEAIPVPGPGDTAIGPKKPKVGSSAEIRATDEDDLGSDFELSSSSNVTDAEPDSGSDFELTALDASSEFDSSPLIKPSDSDVTGALPAESGINLAQPSDSGINLQSFGGLDSASSGATFSMSDLGDEDSDSIELAPLDESGARPSPSMPAAPPPSKSKIDLSATALPVGPGDKDIFSDTDFEVDALDPAQGDDDRTIQLEAASDFDLDESDSGSEVFAIDEDDVDVNAATALGPTPAVMDEEEEEPAAAVSADWDLESEGAPVTGAAARSAAPAAVLTTTAPSAEWGGLWVGLLMVATLFMMLLAFVAMDLVTNLYDYRGTTFAAGLVKSLAGLFGS